MELGRHIVKAGGIPDNPGGIKFSLQNSFQFILEEKAHVLKVLLESSRKLLCSLIFWLTPNYLGLGQIWKQTSKGVSATKKIQVAPPPNGSGKDFHGKKWKKLFI